MVTSSSLEKDEPPAAYAGRVKYDEKQARGYQSRKPAKHRAEMHLIDRAFTLIPKEASVLDAPCGGGRVLVHLAERGYTVTGADLSAAMVSIARENVASAGLPCVVEQQDLERLGFADRQFDAVISFRLFHHFPTASIRQQVVTELCRVARHSVALSYFSPASFTSVKRRLLRTEKDRFATPLREVRTYFTAAGFRLVKDFAQAPLFHTLHLAVFERVDGKP